MSTDPGVTATRSRLLAPFHVPALDGLRALAFLLVFADHSVPATIPVIGRLASAGWTGVELFFALSGFLVTYLLLREEAKEAAEGRPARFSIWKFWARRSLRIWPLYFLGIALAFHVLPHLPPPWNFPHDPPPGAPRVELREYLATSWTFLMNWSVARNGWPSSPFGVLWSVSVEEQFYVMLPIVLLLVPRRFRRAALASAAVAAFAARSLRIAEGAPAMSYYVNTFMRADCFLAGALLADVAVARGGELRPPPWWLALAVPAAYCVNASLEGQGKEPVPLEVLRFLLLDGMAAGAIWLCLGPGLWSRVLSAKPATWLGRISYGLYVWHFLALDAAGVVLQPLRQEPHTALYHAVRVPVALAATILVALVSFTIYERPFLRLKERLH